MRTLDVAKRLIDYGYHPPTVYFPLIVEECLLVEPTETESLETLDAFADALLSIANEARERPELVKIAPVQRTGAEARRDHRRAQARAALAADDRSGDALPVMSG